MELQATVDICLKLHHFRNITDEYQRFLYFTLEVFSGQAAASPYQIIPKSKQSKSNISMEEYISPLFAIAPFGKVILEELVVFKILVPFLALQESSLLCKFSLREIVGEQDRLLEQTQFHFASLLEISAFIPVYFKSRACALDVIINTQILTCRVKNIETVSKYTLFALAQMLTVNFNKLRQVTKSLLDEKDLSINLESYSQLSTIRQNSRTKIFRGPNIDSKKKLITFIKDFVPEISNNIQLLWANSLKQLLEDGIDKSRSSFLKSYSTQIRQWMYQNKKIDLFIVDGLKVPSNPITVHTLYKKQTPSYQKGGEYSREHIVFLVHGYGATSLTLQNLERTLRHLYPHLIIINSTINQNKTEDNLQELGRRLSLEVEASIQSSRFKNDEFSMSFIVHSLGGLITRSALVHLQKYRFHMKSFISLGSPHLGYLYHNSNLTKLGMWIYNKFKKSPAINFLLMNDEQPNYRSSYLYELTTVSGLNWFQEVHFYSSSNDYFVSPQSALCLSSKEITSDYGKGIEKAVIWEEMRNNIEILLQNVGVGKYIVNFDLQNVLKQGDFAEELIGRRDHINLSISQWFMNGLLLAHENIFGFSQ